MYRAGFVALCMGVWGMPCFEGTRPPMIDEALKHFYNDVATLSRDASFFFERMKYSEPALYIAGLKREYMNRSAPPTAAASVEVKR